ncbi:MAG: lecithin retinol acyltransferase family protein [Gomphosphaeria aponina SAG 52.96 = DSM 107014]|uniref:Lecithin retinol acyltransferase family protein n=1 Tax=Gomphosphaeria aponina SAG 52.96 = DSM 107014 TaxID=1521640 RepID=A0A941GX47_9CHRO|nr:lecithin retinol acyltransferase family protein [Gomphosphaeria aponina SAG 52.96 = DSM 107014]
MAQGDQIYVFRDFLQGQGVYEHHGIDCGNGTVIHYRKPSETIERTSLATFTRGNKAYLRQYPVRFCFIPELVVERAESRLGEHKYNLLFNNCEHFATWCKTGISNSKQIKDFIPALSKLNTYNLYEPVKQALDGADPNNAQNLLNGALADIKVVWNQIQPQYNEALQEMNVWHQVAMEAVQRNRDDLARAALQRKLTYKQKADTFQKQLEQLAIMTENLVNS